MPAVGRLPTAGIPNDQQEEQKPPGSQLQLSARHGMAEIAWNVASGATGGVGTNDAVSVALSAGRQRDARVDALIRWPRLTRDTSDP